MKLYGNRAPEFAAGSRWKYSNYGFLLLGVLIEKVSGQSYYDYVRDHIFKPAGMTGTASEPEDRLVADRSVGYTRFDDSALQPNTDTLPYRGTSAGGGYSTVEDLSKFATALQTNKLLDAQHTEMLTMGKVETPNGGQYAYGFQDAGSQRLALLRPRRRRARHEWRTEDLPLPGVRNCSVGKRGPPAASRVADFITNRLPK